MVCAVKSLDCDRPGALECCNAELLVYALHIPIASKPKLILSEHNGERIFHCSSSYFHNFVSHINIFGLHVVVRSLVGVMALCKISPIEVLGNQLF